MHVELSDKLNSKNVESYKALYMLKSIARHFDRSANKKLRDSLDVDVTKGVLESLGVIKANVGDAKIFAELLKDNPKKLEKFADSLIDLADACEVQEETIIAKGTHVQEKEIAPKTSQGITSQNATANLQKATQKSHGNIHKDIKDQGYEYFDADIVKVLDCYVRNKGLRYWIDNDNTKVKSLFQSEGNPMFLTYESGLLVQEDGKIYSNNEGSHVSVCGAVSYEYAYGLEQALEQLIENGYEVKNHTVVFPYQIYRGHWALGRIKLLFDEEKEYDC